MQKIKFDDLKVGKIYCFIDDINTEPTLILSKSNDEVEILIFFEPRTSYHIISKTTWDENHWGVDEKPFRFYYSNTYKKIVFNDIFGAILLF
jgi:hypothetical protein